MNYSEKLKESKEKVYNFAIATKILDLMDKLRMDVHFPQSATKKE